MSTKDTNFSLLFTETFAQGRRRSAQYVSLLRAVWQSAALRRAARVLRRVFLGACIVCGVLYAATRVWLFPWLGGNHEWVAARLSNAAGAQVSLERLEADWFGPRLRLRLGGVTIHSGQRKALRLERVEATLSWLSLPRWMPYFHALKIVGPEIELARDKDGVFTVAGIRMEPDTQARGNPIAWLFEQSRITVRDATLVWNDGLREAPPLRLTEAQFTFERGLFSHLLEFQARPPEALAAKFEVRGDVRRYDSATLDGVAGRFSIGLEQADLGGWAAWVDYPIPCKGRGRARLWLNSDGKGTASLSADLDLEEAETTLSPGLAPLQFNRLSGGVLARYAPGIVELGARGLWLESEKVNLRTPVDFKLELRHADDGTLNGGAFSASLLDLPTLVQLAESLPFGKHEDVRALLAEFNPKGRLQAFSFAWEGQTGALQDWKISTEFEDLGLTAHGLVPGVGGMSGRIKGNGQQGEFAFSSRQGHVDLPKVFDQAFIPFASLDVSGGWNHKNGRLAVTLDAVKFANDDAEGMATGSYWPAESGSGEIDITGELSRAQSAAVWRYIPLLVGEHVRDWLKNAIVQGNATGVKVKLKGPLDHFPFRNGEGEFSVTVPVSDVRLGYANGWPALDRLDGELRFVGPGLFIEAHGGQVFGVQVAPIRASIIDLAEGNIALEGVAKGAGADFLRFIAESPLSAHLHGFTDPLRPEGDGQLDLKLVIPLHDLSKIEVGGEYRFAANRIHLDGTRPGSALESAEGSLRFTKEALETLSIRGRLLGGECVIEGKSGEGGLELNARGQVEAAATRKAFDWPLLGWASGSTPWRVALTFGQDEGRKIVVRSDLKGLRLRLPAPLSKEADETWPLEVEMVSHGADKPRLITVKLGDGIEAALEHDASGGLRGGVGLYRPAPRSSNNGVQVAASLDTLDIDAWQWTLAAGEGEKRDYDDEAALLLSSVMLDAQRVRVFGYTLNALQLRAANNAESWTAHLSSAEAQGVISWKRGGDGMLSAHLKRLALSGGESNGNQDKNGSSSSPPPRGLPGLEVRAEEFAVGARELGRLAVRATNQEGAWRLDHFSIHHPDAQLSGSGLWQPDTQHSTLDFTLDSTNVGRLARSLGYNDVVQGGQAKLTGKVDWKGPPTSINYPTLFGQIELDARKGRFERLEPGVGRLLGVLSLQALPRRVTLDFRDVFSDGFAFDRINGKAAISGGVMHTQGIDVVGPAARVLMWGETDITAETLNLQVKVRPTLSETVALGAAIVSPAVALVTYLAQKTLGDPIERLFSYEYKLTGSWTDPEVEKVVTPTSPPVQMYTHEITPENAAPEEVENEGARGIRIPLSAK